MAKNEKEVNVDVAWGLFKNIIDLTKRNEELKEAYKTADTPEKKAFYVDHARKNIKQLNYAKEKIENLKEYGTVGMGKVFHEFGKKAIKEEGAEGAKFLFKKIAKYMPGASAVAGIMTAFATDDASAAIPVLSEAESVGPEKGSQAYKLESGENVTMPKEDVHAQAEAIRAMQKANTDIKEPQLPVLNTQVVPEEPKAAAEGAIMNDEQADQTLKGIEVEKEHTDKPKVALKIAQDHLKEDPRYYDHLLSMEMENPQSGKNEDIHATGGFVDGKEDQYANDTIDAKLNKGEMVLNIEQQQKLLDKLHGRESNIPNEGSVDKKINKKEMSVDNSTQKQLFDFINDKSKKPQGKIIKPHYENGGGPSIPLDPAQADPNTVDTAVAAPLAPTEAQAPIAQPAAAPAAPIVDKAALIPVAPQSLGTEAQADYNQPVAAPIITPPSIKASQDEVDLEAVKLRKQQAEQEAAQKLQDDNVKNVEDKNSKILASLKLENEKFQKQLDAFKATPVPSKEDEGKITTFWERASTPMKVLAYVSMAIGGLGAAIGNGKNYAAERIQNLIDTDIEAQKLRRQDELAKKELAYKQQVLDLQKASAKINNKLTLMKIADLQQGMQLKADQIGQQRLALAQMQASGEINPALLSKEQGKKYVPGYGLAKDAKSAEAANNAMAAGEQIMRDVAKIEDLWQKHGTREVVNRGAVGAGDNALMSIQLQLKELFNLGVLNGPDMEILNKFAGQDIFSPFTTDARKRASIDGIKEFVSNKIDASLKRAALPETKESRINAANVKEILRANPGKSEAEIITHLKKKNLWR